MLNRLSKRGPGLVTPLIAAFALGACSGSPQRADTEAAGSDLSGEWVLNEQLSDSPAEVLQAGPSQDAATGAIRQLGGSLGVFGISVNDVIRMLPERDGEQDQPDYHSHVTEPRDTLEVEQSENWVEVTYDQAGSAFYPNGKTTHDQLDEIFSDWDGETYVVTREPDDGPVLTETFELSEDGSQLIWTIAFETNSGREIVITRVYDAVETEERTS